MDRKLVTFLLPALILLAATPQAEATTTLPLEGGGYWGCGVGVLFWNTSDCDYENNIFSVETPGVERVTVRLAWGPVSEHTRYMQLTAGRWGGGRTCAVSGCWSGVIVESPFEVAMFSKAPRQISGSFQSDPPTPTASTSGPRGYTVNPPYQFAGSAEVRFWYDVTSERCHGTIDCDTQSEWRIYMNGSYQEGVLPPGVDPNGDLIAGDQNLHPARGETLDYSVNSTVDTSYLLPGVYTVKVAVRAIASNAYSWRVDSQNITILSVDDHDSDGIPDALEIQLCDNQLERDTINGFNGNAGACTPGDYTPPSSSNVVELEIPTHADPAEDADSDTIPAGVVLTMTHISINRTDPVGHGPKDGGQYYVPLDPDDGDQNVPIPSTACRPLSVDPSTAAYGDHDGDGIPGSLAIRSGEICADRNDPGIISITPGLNVATVPLDPDDNDPNTPTAQQIDLPPIVGNVTYGHDGDEDGLIDYAYYGMDTYHFNRSNSVPLTKTRSVQAQPIDTNDNDRNQPVPYNTIDQDHDNIPDAAEPFACLVQKDSTDLDGHCRDGAHDYDAPWWYTQVLQEIPPCPLLLQPTGRCDVPPVG